MKIRAPVGRRAPHSRLGQVGFTLTEVVIAVLILSVLVVANLSAISFSRVQTERAKDEAVVVDFITHYLEMVKGLPFEDVRAGRPINPLLDGDGGGVRIAIPTSADWFSLDTDDFLAFHTELAWLTTKNPEMRAQLTVTQVGGVDHTKSLQLEVRWDAPLGRGGRLTSKFNLVRFKDV